MVTPTLAYRLAEMRQYESVVQVCKHTRLLDWLNRSGRWDDYLALVRVGTAAAECVGDANLAIELLLRLARKLPQRGDLAGAEEALLHARELGERKTGRSFRGQLISHSGLLQQFRGELADARRSYEAALDTEEDPHTLCVVHKQLGHVYQALGDSERALEHYRTASDLGVPDDRHPAEARLNIALSKARIEGPDEAHQLVGTLIKEFRELSQPYPAGLSRALLAFALISWQRGDQRSAVAAARETLAITETDPRLRLKAAELLSRWTPSPIIRVVRSVRKLWRRVRRGGSGHRADSTTTGIARYEQGIAQLYGWVDGQSVSFEEKVTRTEKLGADLVTFALGTGMDHGELESVFHRVDTETVELLDG